MSRSGCAGVDDLDLSRECHGVNMALNRKELCGVGATSSQFGTSLVYEIGAVSYS
jgi:hypothetical protein